MFLLPMLHLILQNLRGKENVCLVNPQGLAHSICSVAVCSWSERLKSTEWQSTT